jgi:hypothetical protein
MQQIPIQSVPSQRISVVLGTQNCQIAIYLLGDNLYVDLNSNGIDISTGIIALDCVPLSPFNYSGFSGNLVFCDTQAANDPTYDGLGSRYVLLYLDGEEYEQFFPE